MTEAEPVTELSAFSSDDAIPTEWGFADLRTSRRTAIGGQEPPVSQLSQTGGVDLVRRAMENPGCRSSVHGLASKSVPFEVTKGGRLESSPRRTRVR